MSCDLPCFTEASVILIGMISIEIVIGTSKMRLFRLIDATLIRLSNSRWMGDKWNILWIVSSATHGKAVLGRVGEREIEKESFLEKDVKQKRMAR